MKNGSARISNLDFRGSSCDGPGIRNVVFFQGCTRHCPGCHNPATWNPCGGYSVKINDLVDLIKSKTPMHRITISGGEPLLQLDGLMELVRQLREARYDIAVYTGNRLEDVPPELLSMINYIKVGDYRKEYHTTVKEYVGSTNQEFIKLR